MKGIILAAGKGTRLYPMTNPVCKLLLPVYDKPMIYYPLSVLLQAGIRDILIIIPPGEQKRFSVLLGNGKQMGININYKVQTVARGIADAFLVGEEFIEDDNVCLILGDNIFCGDSFQDLFVKAQGKKTGATVFGYWVEDPRPFGVVEFDERGRAISIEEKPQNPKSNYIIPGIYFYDNQVVKIAKDLKPSVRGELEITDINLHYLKQRQLQVEPFSKGLIWLDAGTADSLLEAAQIIKTMQESGQYVGCIEETAWKKGFMTKEQLLSLAEKMAMTKYGQYLKDMII